MQETLRLDITADNREAIAVLKQTENQLKVFERALAKATDPKQLIYLQKNIDFIKGKMTSLAQATPKLVNNTNQAANALTNLGRVAQDAPFGFIGIQNNLNPLLESFQRLKSESGSTGGALKALAGSLMGPAGLGLALSVGSALLLTFGDKLMSASKETVALNKSQAEFTDTLSKSMGAAKAEIATMQSLLSIVNDVTLSTDERKRALKQLKEEYPGYNELQKVDINDAAKLIKVTDALSEAIIRKARAQAYSTIIAEEEAKQFKVSIENDKQRAERLNKLSQGLKEYVLPLMSLIDPTKANIVQSKLAADAVDEASDAYDFGSKYLLKMKDMLNATTKEQIKFNDAQMLGSAGKEAKIAGTELEKYLATREIISKAGFKPVTGVPLTAGVQGQTGVASKENIQLEQSALMTKEQLILKNANAQKLYNEQQAQANSLAEIGAGVFTDLGNAMLTGQDMGEALANTFKKLAADLAQMVIKALIFKAIMAVITSGGSEATGGATAGMSIFNGMSFADGGIASGPKSGYPALLHGTEAILNPGQFKNLTSNMMNMGAMQGKSNDSGGFVASTSIRGSEMLLMIKRAEANMGLKRG
jgi:hypothetical protein